MGSQGRDKVMATLVLLRHGLSAWNKENRFTGWTDVDLVPDGVAQASAAGEQLRDAGFGFDTCYTSVLKRAIKTLDLALEAMGLLWLPVEKSWRLNERHYGALEGLNKAEMAVRAGADQVQAWRRSWDVRPPLVESDDKRHPSQDVRYRSVPAGSLPAGESLKDTVQRVMPLWHGSIAPALMRGERVLVAAHGNSLRGLVKYLSGIADEDIKNFSMPVGAPLVFKLDAELRPMERAFLS